MSTTTEQRHQALDRANAVRLARSDLRHRIARGEVFAASVILDPPPEAETWPVAQLVLSQPGLGERRMRRLLGRLAISGVKPAGELTDRQRRVLARALGQEHPR